MTPYIRSLSTKGHHVIEISEGTDFDRKALYGVSVANRTQTGFEMNKSGFNKCFGSLDEARFHAKNIRKMLS